MRIPKFAALLVGLTLLATACGPGAPPSGDVVATVDGKEITAVELEKRFRKSQGTEMASSEETGDARLQVLGQMINDEILLSMATKQEVSVTDAEVDAKFNAFKGQYSESAFEELLKEQQSSADGLKADMRRALILDKFVNKEATSKVKVSNEEIQAFYEQNRRRFNLPESFHIAHILVTKFEDSDSLNAKNDDAKTPEQARQKVLKLVRDVQGGTDFAAVARDYSEDPTSAAQGGDIGFQTGDALSNIDPRIAQVVLKMKKGEIWSQAIETRFGFHVVKLIDKDSGGQKDLGDPRVQSIAHREIFARKDQALKTALADVARNGAAVRNYLAERMLAAAAP